MAEREELLINEWQRTAASLSLGQSEEGRGVWGVLFAGRGRNLLVMAAAAAAAEVPFNSLGKGRSFDWRSQMEGRRTANGRRRRRDHLLLEGLGNARGIQADGGALVQAHRAGDY